MVILRKIPQNYLFSKIDLKKLIVPLVIEQFLTIAVGLIDSMMVASVGESAVSAISLVDTVNILIINIFTALATGGAVVAGQYIGMKQEHNSCKAANQTLIFTTLIALFVMIIVYVLKNFILHTVFGQIEDDVANYANTYLLIVSASIPFIGMYNAGAAIFRAMGNSKVSMNTSLIMNLAAHPHNPLRLSPCQRENILLYFPWPKGHRGAYIINIFFPYFTTNPFQLVPPIGGIYYQYIFSLFSVDIIACPGGSCKAPGQASFTAPYRPRYGPVPDLFPAAAPLAQVAAHAPFRPEDGTALASADPGNPAPPRSLPGAAPKTRAPGSNLLPGIPPAL